VATYLDVLVELLTDPDARSAYQKDRSGWLRAAGVGFLCGEDIAAAGPVLRTWLPQLVSPFDVLEKVDPAPSDGEGELDAAIRLIDEMCDAAPLDDVDEVEEDRSASVG
jgi:hypothetical protein